MHTVLLPIDGSDHAFAAALYLIRLARQLGAIDVHVVHIEPAPLAWQSIYLDPEAIEGELNARAHIAMNPVLTALNKAGISHRAHVRLGDPAETIVALAKELACDSIVLGTRGLGSLASLALGSVTRKVLHLTRLPVICVKADGQ